VRLTVSFALLTSSKCVSTFALKRSSSQLPESRLVQNASKPLDKLHLMKIPNESVAASIAKREVGETPTAVRRFPNGVHHYVHEVEFARHTSVVVRLTRSSERLAMQGASVLSAFLRPRGVPLPQILAQNLDDEFPWLLQERLPGTDLGNVIARLSDATIGSASGSDTTTNRDR
jgi:hypothetical protein